MQLCPPVPLQFRDGSVSLAHCQSVGCEQIDGKPADVSRWSVSAPGRTPGLVAEAAFEVFKPRDGKHILVKLQALPTDTPGAFVVVAGIRSIKQGEQK